MKICIFWHRRDLRIHDNAGLAAALASGLPVLPLFIYDQEILDHLPEKADARLTFIFDEVEKLAHETETAGGTFLARYGSPLAVLAQLLEDFDVAAVHTNEDYEPYATKRDTAVGELLEKHGTDFFLYKDQVIFAKDEIMTKSGTVPKVFGAYLKAYTAKLTDDMLLPYGSKGNFKSEHLHHVSKDQAGLRPTLASMGFERKEQYFPPVKLPAESIVRNYHKTRNTPANEHGTTRESLNLRFGTLSVREALRQAKALNDKLLAEIIWRDFFMMLLWHFPNTATESYDPKMRHIDYRNNEDEFRAWCEGRTGYPLVDAGMRELNQTGYLPNRVRMTVAGFLVKHLFIDWRWGEKYFADKLLDYEMANNVGNWQWMAGTGAISAPWFRVYSPDSQLEKVDPEMTYVKRWVPEVGTSKYPKPIVEHKFGRERSVEAIRAACYEPDSPRSGYTCMEKDHIKQAYLDFVLNEGHPPQSVFKLTQQLGVAESEFYQQYPNFESIDREIWADFGRQARETAAAEPVWEGYGSREKLLAFYYTLLEILKNNRSYALMSLRRSLKKMPGLSPRVLDDFRQDFEYFVSDLLSAGRVSGEIANRPLVQEGYPRFFWQQVLFVMGFFAKDDTVNFERTDAAVEKAVTLSFDLVGRNTLDSAFDFVRFLVKR